VAIFLNLTLPANVGAQKVFKIGMTQIVSHPALNEIRDGFVQGMAEQGFVQGKNVEYEFLNPEGDMTVAKTIADKFVSAPKRDLIAPITTACTQAIVNAATGTGIPIVFVAVTDPIGAGIVPSWDKPCRPGVRITGMSDYVPVRPQLETLKAICPRAKVLGIIYNAGDESNTMTVNEMRKLAPEFGLKLVEANVATTADTYNAANSLVGRADAMWYPMCNTTSAGLEGLISVAEQNKIPVFGPSVPDLKKGVIAAVAYRNTELGKLGAKKAARVLRGADPCTIPVSTHERIDICLNPGAAKKMGVTIPQALMDKAYYIEK